MSKQRTIHNKQELREVAREVLAASDLYRWHWPDESTVQYEWLAFPLELYLDKKKVTFLVSFHLAPTARDVEHVVKRADPEYPPLLIAPALSEVLVGHCRTHGVNCLDLNGRQWIRAEGIVIDRQPSGVPRYGPAHLSLDPFQPKSARLVRILLAERERVWTQRDLIEATGLSPGMISRLVRQFVNEGLLSQDHRSIQLIQFDTLLDSWKREDQWAKRTTIRQYSTLIPNLMELAHKAKQYYANRNLAFTQWFAANLRYSYTTPPLLSAYVSSYPDSEFEREVMGRQVTNGGTLWLIIPKDEGVFQATQKAKDLTLVSDVQIYLDLQQAGFRGDDQAEALREWEGFGKRNQ